MMDVYTWLDQREIEYRSFDHPPLYTCEDAARLAPPMPGPKCKNLFLRDRRGRRHVLLMLGADQQVDLREFGRRLQAPGLGFASPERLYRYLGVRPGAVSALALINDRGRDVEFVIDRGLAESSCFQCHPLVNTATLVLERRQLQRVLEATGHAFAALDMPPRT